MKSALVRVWLGVLLLLGSLGVLAEIPYQQGEHYVAISSKVLQNYTVQEFTKGTQSKVQIIEFFNYGCHWCNEFEPFFTKWQKQHEGDERFEFVRIPVVFHPAWRPLAKAYYTAEQLEVNEPMDSVLFNAIHVEQQTLMDAEVIKALFVKNGIEADSFSTTYGGFSVNRQLKEANQLAVAYRVTMIPQVIVNGPAGSFMTAPSMAGNNQKTIHILDELVKQNLAQLAS